MNTAKALAEQQELVDAARGGNRLEMLIALRDMLAERLQAAKADRDVASLSKRLMQCAAEIDQLQMEQAAIVDKRKALLKQQRAFVSGRITADHPDLENNRYVLEE